MEWERVDCFGCPLYFLQLHRNGLHDFLQVFEVHFHSTPHIKPQCIVGQRVGCRCRILIMTSRARRHVHGGVNGYFFLVEFIFDADVGSFHDVQSRTMHHAHLSHLLHIFRFDQVRGEEWISTIFNRIRGRILQWVWLLIRWGLIKWIIRDRWIISTWNNWLSVSLGVDIPVKIIG